MAAATVRVRGLREVDRAFRRLSGDLSRELRDELRESADPVRQEARSLFAPISAASASGFQVVVRARGVVVQQRNLTTTGDRPHFGAMQMTRALLPALARRESQVIRGVERMLDRLAGENGF